MSRHKIQPSYNHTLSLYIKVITLVLIKKNLTLALDHNHNLNLTLAILVKVSIDVKRYHDHGNSSKENIYLGQLANSVRSSVHYHHDGDMMVCRQMWCPTMTSSNKTIITWTKPHVLICHTLKDYGDQLHSTTTLF